MKTSAYRQIRNSDLSIFNPEQFTILEAGFSLREDGYPFLSVKILDSDNTEIFSTLSADSSDVYRSVSYVNPALHPSFQSFIQDIEQQSTPEDERAYFSTVYPGVTLEVGVAPFTPREYRVIIYLYHYMIMSQYQWRSGSSISVSMMCKGDDLMNFLKELNSDLELLLS
ncbi:MAG: hypothetical protein WCD18_08565 [Thermosynechococcaceae cyanobacterium]